MYTECGSDFGGRNRLGREERDIGNESRIAE